MTSTGKTQHGLPGYALFGALLASAGLPIYIHAPKFYLDSYGVSLAALGAVLFALRMIDFVQDPLLGWVSGRLQRNRGVWRGFWIGLAIAAMAVSMVALFAIPPLFAPLVWFAGSLTVLFTAYSFLTITFYARGVRKAEELGARGHIRVATWRETGALIGVCLAAIAPTVFAATSNAPFAIFAAGFCGLALIAGWAMRPEWRREWDNGPPAGESGFRHILSDRIARRLLLIALVNATPVAVTSTLFLFFVESRLEAPGLEGPLLLLFFAAAAGSAPVWGRLAQRFGPKNSLLAGMILSVAAFGFAATLGAGDTVAFAVICLASGAALGADMTLLPAIFSTHLAQIAPNASQAFGLWSFVSKFTLAFAAVSLLPILDKAGFTSGGDNPASALSMLTYLYAIVPCALKVVAILLLVATPMERS